MTIHTRTVTRTTTAGALVAGIALAGATGVAPGRATAAPVTAVANAPVTAVDPGSVLDRLPADVRRRMVAQAPLVDAASALRSAIERGNPRGFAGIGLVDDHVTLWWKGRVPADIAVAVASARHTAPIEVAAAAYSRTQLDVAAAKVDAVVKADPSDAAHAVKIPTDGSGLVVAVDGPAADLPRLPTTGVRTTTVAQRRMKPVSRSNDTAPFKGGSLLHLPDGTPWCTVGWGVRDSAGAPFLLSAAHCGDQGQQYKTGSGQLIGTVTRINKAHDVMLISTPTPGNTMYVGGLNDEAQLPVTGWTEVFPGQLLCQSGATSARPGYGSAPVCNLEVKFHYDDSENLVEATQTDGLEAARPGDSGGPVYALAANGSVLAAGTTTRVAWSGFGFQDFATAREDLGGVLPLTAAPRTCRVSYVVDQSWAGGFRASVTVYHNGPAVNRWSVGFTLPGGQVVQGRWGAYFEQNTAAVTATNEPHNAVIPADGAVTFGFTAGGSAVTPTSFTLNGATCA